MERPGHAARLVQRRGPHGQQTGAVAGDSPDSPVGDSQAVLSKDGLDATAHSSQQNHLRLPRRLPAPTERFKEESWAEVARRPGISLLNMRRWKAGKRPNLRHQVALLELADQLDLGHLLTDWSARHGTVGPPGSN